MKLVVIVGMKKSMLCPLIAHCCQFPKPVTRNLPVFEGIINVRMSLLQLIMLPLRLMGLIIVTVVLIKEPLLKVTCATSEESSIRFNLTVLLNVLKGNSVPVLVLITQRRNPNSVVHQNTTSSGHVASMPLT